jgi:uncharacterized membrane protein
VTRAYRRYLVEFWVAMGAYVVVIAVSRRLLEGPLRGAGPWVQVLVAVSPVVPVAMLFAAVVRLILHTDEMQRRVYIESLAAAGGATALLAVTYGLIESERFPHLSAWWTWGVFGVAWIISTFVVRRRYRG